MKSENVAAQLEKCGLPSFALISGYLKEHKSQSQGTSVRNPGDQRCGMAVRAWWWQHPRSPYETTSTRSRPCFFPSWTLGTAITLMPRVHPPGSPATTLATSQHLLLASPLISGLSLSPSHVIFPQPPQTMSDYWPSPNFNGFHVYCITSPLIWALDSDIHIPTKIPYAYPTFPHRTLLSIANLVCQKLNCWPSFPISPDF